MSQEQGQERDTLSTVSRRSSRPLGAVPMRHSGVEVTTQAPDGMFYTQRRGETWASARDFHANAVYAPDFEASQAAVVAMDPDYLRSFMSPEDRARDEQKAAQQHTPEQQ